MSDIQEKVKQTVKEEVDRVARLSTDAVRSYAYLYPFRLSFLSRPALSTLIISLGS